MNPTEIAEMATALDDILASYEKYRLFQEQEHAHLTVRGSVAEWNVLVRQKHLALQKSQHLSLAFENFKKQWHLLGEQRNQPQYRAIRDKIAQIQGLLTRILTCDRMNEVLLYNGGYLQSVVAYRSFHK